MNIPQPDAGFPEDPFWLYVYMVLLTLAGVIVWVVVLVGGPL